MTNQELPIFGQHEPSIDEPVGVRFVLAMVLNAIKRGQDYVHFDLVQSQGMAELIVRYRKDGEFQETARLTADAWPEAVKGMRKIAMVADELSYAKTNGRFLLRMSKNRNFELQLMSLPVATRDQSAVIALLSE